MPGHIDGLAGSGFPGDRLADPGQLGGAPRPQGASHRGVMRMLDQLPFGAVWVVDFEYTQPDGGLPDPLCVVGLELRTGARIAQWLTPGDGISCPYETGANAVLIGHNFTAETLCHLVRGWPTPITSLTHTSRSKRPSTANRSARPGSSRLQPGSASRRSPLLPRPPGARSQCRAAPIAEQHREELIHYCGTDVDTNADLLRALLPKIFARKMGLARSLMWGSYMVALAHVEYVGVPINTDLLTRLQTHWADIKHRLIDRLDAGRTDCYVDYTFNRKRFSDLLDRLGLLDTWPRSETLGWPSTEEEIFKERAHGHPVLGPLFELHYTLQHLRKLTLHVGPDGRHRQSGSWAPAHQTLCRLIRLWHANRPKCAQGLHFRACRVGPVSDPAHERVGGHLFRLQEPGGAYRGAQVTRP